mmetsp:Transcript_14873/g.40951  ORF Transcript_14873/g.40951 Transcript_14873/m.40951 type:complete len:243 (-) Transcript_14873:556-1284(-)
MDVEEQKPYIPREQPLCEISERTLDVVGHISYPMFPILPAEALCNRSQHSDDMGFPAWPPGHPRPALEHNGSGVQSSSKRTHHPLQLCDSGGSLGLQLCVIRVQRFQQNLAFIPIFTLGLIHHVLHRQYHRRHSAHDRRHLLLRLLRLLLFLLLCSSALILLLSSSALLSQTLLQRVDELFVALFTRLCCSHPFMQAHDFRVSFFDHCLNSGTLFNNHLVFLLTGRHVITLVVGKLLCRLRL